MWNRGSFPARHTESRPIDLCSIKNRTFLATTGERSLCRAFNWANALRCMRNNDRKKQRSERWRTKNKNKIKKKKRRSCEGENKTKKVTLLHDSRRLFVILYFTRYEMATFRKNGAKVEQKRDSLSRNCNCRLVSLLPIVVRNNTETRVEGEAENVRGIDVDGRFDFVFHSCHRGGN